ncbi:CobW family GTP-binding protein [Oceanobacter mangrovi]|uniref:CobW family GTP-binding protein n=1 Tax=Oceanobacter mangrovi TaxID=2862510 RepID=UPI001C8DA92A|nr:GTP-binding protein [Oceanobacter mangrovi]
MTSDSRLPVNVLTGFLGAGKTTLLKHWLQSPQLANTAVIINELGAVGLDHLLVDNSQESLFLLDNGCLCCAVRDDLITSLQDLQARRAGGELPAFDRVVIETTGLADPLPVLQTLMMAEGVVEHFRADAVITCVDGVNGIKTLENYPEALKQVELADVLLVTKQDLSAAADTAVTERLAEINPLAQRLLVSNGQLDASVLLQSALLPLEQQSARQLPASAASGAHSGRVRSLVLMTDDAISNFDINCWLEIVTSVYEGQLLRLKGLVKEASNPQQPLLLHAVQALVSDPQRLDQWPSSDQRTRIVLIGERLDEEDIRRVFQTFTGARLIDSQQNPLALLGVGSLKPV